MSKIELYISGKERKMYQYDSCISDFVETRTEDEARHVVAKIQAMLNRQHIPEHDKKVFNKLKAFKGANLWRFTFKLAKVDYRITCYYHEREKNILAMSIMTKGKAEKYWKNSKTMKRINNTGDEWHKEFEND